MQIVGQKLEKIHAERKGTLSGNLQINMNVDVTKVEIKNIFPGGIEKPGISFDFKYKADYGGNSEISVEGSIFGAGEEKELKKIVKDWKADKFDAQIDALIKNRILVIGLGKAIPLAEGLNLPLPMRMPGRFVPPSEKKK